MRTTELEYLLMGLNAWWALRRDEVVKKETDLGHPFHDLLHRSHYYHD